MNADSYTTGAYLIGLGMIAAYLLSLTWQWYAISRRGVGPGDDA